MGIPRGFQVFKKERALCKNRPLLPSGFPPRNNPVARKSKQEASFNHGLSVLSSPAMKNETHLTEDQIGEYSGDSKEIRPVTLTTYQILTYRKKKSENLWTCASRHRS